MKNILNLLLIAFLILFAQCSYEKESLDKDCKQYEQSEIERSFHLSVVAMYQDSVPYYGMVYMTTQKSYCNGDISGVFNLKGNPDEYGYWAPVQAPTYKFANAFDRVDVNIHVTVDGTSHEIKDEYYYIDVEQQYFGIEKIYYLVIPQESNKN